VYSQSLLDFLSHNLCPEINITEWAGISGFEAIWAKCTTLVSDCKFHISVLEGRYFEHNNMKERICFSAYSTHLVGAWQSGQTSIIHQRGSHSQLLFFYLGERVH